MGSLNPPFHLHPAVLGHGQRITVPDDEMIEHPHIDQVQRLLQAFGQHSVGLAGIGISRRMVMTEDQRCGVVGQCAFNHLSRIDTRTVDGPAKQHFKGQHLMPGIQKKTAEHLVRLMAQH